jgi:hypothetical protein
MGGGGEVEGGRRSDGCSIREFPKEEEGGGEGGGGGCGMMCTGQEHSIAMVWWDRQSWCGLPILSQPSADD